MMELVEMRGKAKAGGLRRNIKNSLMGLKCMVGIGN